MMVNNLMTPVSPPKGGGFAPPTHQANAAKGKMKNASMGAAATHTRILLAAGAAALLALFSSAPSNASTANDWRFALTTLSGREVTTDSYRGKWLLIYFGYTFCPDVCPATLTELGDALKALGPRANR